MRHARRKYIWPGSFGILRGTLLRLRFCRREARWWSASMRLLGQTGPSEVVAALRRFAAQAIRCASPQLHVRAQLAPACQFAVELVLSVPESGIVRWTRVQQVA